LNPAVILAVSAGVAIALQVVVNSIGLRDLGPGGLILISGATTALAGLAWALFAARPEATGRALLCASASGLLGAFILASIVLAANRGGLAQKASQHATPLRAPLVSTLRAYKALACQHFSFSLFCAERLKACVAGVLTSPQRGRAEKARSAVLRSCQRQRAD
jgi:hypothetical protein